MHLSQCNYSQSLQCYADLAAVAHCSSKQLRSNSDWVYVIKNNGSIVAAQLQSNTHELQLLLIGCADWLR